MADGSIAEIMESVREQVPAHRGKTFHYNQTPPDDTPTEHPSLQRESVDREDWPPLPEDLVDDTRRLVNLARERGRVPLDDADDLLDDTFAGLSTLRERELVRVEQSGENGVVLPVEPDDG